MLVLCFACRRVRLPERSLFAPSLRRITLTPDALTPALVPNPTTLAWLQPLIAVSGATRVHLVEGTKQDQAVIEELIPSEQKRPPPSGAEGQAAHLQAFYEAARRTVKTSTRIGSGGWALGGRSYDEVGLALELEGVLKGRTLFVLPWRLAGTTGITLTDTPIVAMAGLMYDAHGSSVWASFPPAGPHERHVHISTWELLPQAEPEHAEKIKFVRRIHEGNAPQ